MILWILAAVFGLAIALVILYDLWNDEPMD